MKLKAMGFGSTRPARVKVATAVAVTLEDGAADGGGDVTSAPARIRLLGILLERVRALAADAARFDPAEVDEELGEQLVRAAHEAAGLRRGARRRRDARSARAHSSEASRVRPREPALTESKF